MNTTAYPLGSDEPIETRVFSLSRSTKTTKGTHIGDFSNLQDAESAMIQHYKETPKRGEFSYYIYENTIVDRGTYKTRMYRVFQDYSKIYRKDMLAAMANN